MAAWLLILTLIGAAIALFVTNDSGTIGGMPNEIFARLVFLVSLLVFVGGSIMSSYRGRAFQAVKHLAGWGLLLLVLVGVYTYRLELAVVADRMMGELSPQGTQVNVTGTTGAINAVRIKRGWSGHFVVTANIQERPVEMIVDTGASTVVLRHQDARQLGIDTRNLRYNVPVQTANGSSYAARVYLEEISVGQVAVHGVEALIAKPGSLHQSLLGMSFLSRLRSYEFAGDFLELRG